MGLDMYLSARRSVYSPAWDKSRADSPEGKIGRAVRRAMKVRFDSKNLNYTRVEIEVAYWRKDNAVHAWFVDNCQNGVDDCGDYPVEREQLQELIDKCRAVLKTPKDAANIMATRSGFFFGETEYDKWYFSGLRDTIKQLTKCLKLPEDWSFYYHSSW